MLSDETSDAVAAFLTTLAPLEGFSFPGGVASTQNKFARLSLPGTDSDDKSILERELSALASRVQHLEARANAFNGNAFPATPGEYVPTVPFPVEALPTAAAHRNASPLPSPTRKSSGGSRDLRTNWVKSWLARKESTLGDQQPPGPPLNEEQLGYIRDHVTKQSDQIQTQREHIEELSNQLMRQKQAQDQAFGHSIDDIDALKRELQKHQQANMAFQKALREIGSIVTAVAAGDLSKKVLIHAKEMDPEITAFKITINDMVDQLQLFSSQVTQLAKEVGTEGQLGGQANVPGVRGIWFELTNNGMELLNH